MLPHPPFPELSTSNFCGSAAREPPLLLPGNQEAHIWVGAVPPLERLLPWVEMLSPKEQERAERLQPPDSRRRFLAGRLLLKMLLSRYTGIPPQAILLEQAPTGKPYWPDPPLPLQFNLSHSHERVLVGLRLQGRIGVDLERIRPLPCWQRIARRYFSAAEQARLSACTAAEREPLFFQMWAQKEALLKGVGLGLAGSRAVVGDPNWVTLPLRVADDYAAAVALEVEGGEPPVVHLCREMGE